VSGFLAALAAIVWLHDEAKAVRQTFLKNHLANLVSVDFFVVPTATFRVLYVFMVLSHHRRRVVRFNVTASPTGAGTGALGRPAPRRGPASSGASRSATT
jgi:hypothetical protein